MRRLRIGHVGTLRFRSWVHIERGDTIYRGRDAFRVLAPLMLDDDGRDGRYRYHVRVAGILPDFASGGQAVTGRPHFVPWWTRFRKD